MILIRLIFAVALALLLGVTSAFDERYDRGRRYYSTGESRLRTMPSASSLLFVFNSSRGGPVGPDGAERPLGPSGGRVILAKRGRAER